MGTGEVILIGPLAKINIKSKLIYGLSYYSNTSILIEVSNSDRYLRYGRSLFSPDHLGRFFFLHLDFYKKRCPNLSQQIEKNSLVVPD